MSQFQSYESYEADENSHTEYHTQHKPCEAYTQGYYSQVPTPVRSYQNVLGQTSHHNIQQPSGPKEQYQVTPGMEVEVLRAWMEHLPNGSQGIVVKANVDGRHVVRWHAFPGVTGTVSAFDDNWRVVTRQDAETVYAIAQNEYSSPPAPASNGSTPNSSRPSSPSSTYSFGMSCSSEKDETPAAKKEPRTDIATAIVYDWDDTLLPSHFLAKIGAEPITGALAHIDPASVRQLADIEDMVCKILKRSIEAVGEGNVIIITAAQNGWIDISAEAFMPRTIPYLEKCHIISARSMFEPQGVSISHWKHYAFQFALQNYFQCEWGVSVNTQNGQAELKQPKQAPKAWRSSVCLTNYVSAGESADAGTAASAAMMQQVEEQDAKYWSTRGQNALAHQLETAIAEGEIRTMEENLAMYKMVISIGDSHSEWLAATQVSQCCPNTFLKTLKLQDRPSLADLTHELQTLEYHLTALLSEQKHSAYELHG